MNHTTNKETHHVRRLAKAVSAFTFGRSASGAGHDLRIFPTREALGDSQGSGAPFSAATSGALAKVAMLVAALVLLLVPASASAADPPAATTDPASGVTTTGVTLNGSVNPNGAAVASCRFEYGTTTAYGAAVPCEPSSLGSGIFNVPVSASLENLEKGTTFHYRLIAASVNGATNGADRTFTTEGTPVCPNADRRLEQGILAIQLPDCMALEQVSPPRKINQRAASPTISADGERIAYYSLAALADTPGNLNAIDGDLYLADRTGQGWATTPTSPPYPFTLGWGEGKLMVRSLDPSLSRWVALASTAQQYPLGVGQLFRGGIGGAFAPQSPVLTPVGGAASSSVVDTASLHGASSDHSRMFLVPGGQASTRYDATDPVVTGGGSDRNLYVAGLDSNQQPSLALAARDQNGKTWGGNCGSRLGGVPGNSSTWRNQGAVSADGSRAYISARAAQPETGNCSEAAKLRILQRDETPSGVEITELIASECDREAPDPLCSATDGDDLFQGASVDQSKVYFITNRQLADSDLDGAGFPSGCAGFLVGGCDLYLYDAARPAGERLTQVSAGEATPQHPTIGSGAGVSGTVAISGDGSRVYFAATGVLTAGPNPAGQTAAEFAASAPKLYTWDTGSEAIGFVGALAASDAGLLWAGHSTYLNAAYPVPVNGTGTAGTEVGGTGGILFFSTRAQLTPEDADGARTDAYRYDAGSAPPTLECISCRPGGPDADPIDITVRGASPAPVVGTAFAEVGRWVSEDGGTALIQTREALTKQDLNDLRDDYMWSSGKLTLIPGTTFSGTGSSVGQTPPVLSHDGKQLSFTAYTPLLPSDGDTALDVYVARAGGGFPFPPPEPECAGEGCRAAPAGQPAGQTAASETTLSRGNVQPVTKPKRKARCPKGKRKVTRKGKTRCVKKQKKRSAKHRRANRNQGGQK